MGLSLAQTQQEVFTKYLEHYLPNIKSYGIEFIPMYWQFYLSVRLIDMNFVARFPIDAEWLQIPNRMFDLADAIIAEIRNYRNALWC